jgi:hypothetical protein
VHSWSACEGSAVVSDRYRYVLVEKNGRESEAWQQDVDCSVALSEAEKSRLVRLFYIRTGIT